MTSQRLVKAVDLQPGDQVHGDQTVVCTRVHYKFKRKKKVMEVAGVTICWVRTSDTGEPWERESYIADYDALCDYYVYNEVKEVNAWPHPRSTTWANTAW